jgi:hypothetical protein
VLKESEGDAVCEAVEQVDADSVVDVEGDPEPVVLACGGGG